MYSCRRLHIFPEMLFAIDRRVVQQTVQANFLLSCVSSLLVFLPQQPQARLAAAWTVNKSQSGVPSTPACCQSILEIRSRAGEGYEGCRLTIREECARPEGRDISCLVAVAYAKCARRLPPPHLSVSIAHDNGWLDDVASWILRFQIQEVMVDSVEGPHAKRKGRWVVVDRPCCGHHALGFEVLQERFVIGARLCYHDVHSDPLQCGLCVSTIEIFELLPACASPRAMQIYHHMSWVLRELHSGTRPCILVHGELWLLRHLLALSCFDCCDGGTKRPHCSC